MFIKVNGRIIANLIAFIFWWGCSLLNDQHSYADQHSSNS